MFKKKISFILLSFILLSVSHFSTAQTASTLTFPWSQWIVNKSAHNAVWEYESNFRKNESFIALPKVGEWDNWYKQIIAYRNEIRAKAGAIDPILTFYLPSKREHFFHFDKIGYDLLLQPKETLVIKGDIKNGADATKLYFYFDLKYKGEDQTYKVRKQLLADSMLINSDENWHGFSKNVQAPAYNTDSFVLTPVVKLKATNISLTQEVQLNNIQIIVEQNANRQALYSKINKFLAEQKANNAFRIPNDLAWTHTNFVMGFAFIWDTDFWDAKKGKYKTDEYCYRIKKEFGGMQSVVLWHSYPNIGIDEKNQFDFFYQMPGGLKGLKKVVADFHKNNVKVFLTYNPWDYDTRRAERSDYKELSYIIDYTNADGLYLDTWSTSLGPISSFNAEKTIREELKKYNRNVAFTTEILPDLKDLYGENALTSSWGQEIDPFHFTDLSFHKWIMPEHKQYYIKRLEKNRKPILTHAWLNGQGIQVWENVFGTMNVWDAKSRQILRKMNAIWAAYGDAYLTDNWLPFLPTNNSEVLSSKWMTKDYSIWNLADTTENSNFVKIEAIPGKRYFDLWTGRELDVKIYNGKYFVECSVDNFSCIIETAEITSTLEKLLKTQQAESKKGIAATKIEDAYYREKSLKFPVVYPYKQKENSEFKTDLEQINGGQLTLLAKHVWREGRCYPDMDAKNNHDLDQKFEQGKLLVNHKFSHNFSDFKIMPRAVTNAQFEQFLKASKYKPRFKENFLKHWNGATCPAELRNKAVCYVSLEDARAFAEWAGMRLPTEWEWQLAAEKLGSKFIFNEKFEWNESERYDGYNRFVTLRGGCKDWTMSTSDWYFPGNMPNKPIGGEQKYNAHVKYFLMYEGIDRASTIGFRCVK